MERKLIEAQLKFEAIQDQTNRCTPSCKYPLVASTLRKHGYVMFKNRPCKIVNLTKSKTGKHGHAKIHLLGLDLFTGKQYEDIVHSTENMEAPKLTQTDFIVVDIVDGYLSLTGDAGEIRDDVKLPAGNIGAEIESKFNNEEMLVVNVLEWWYDGRKLKNN